MFAGVYANCVCIVFLMKVKVICNFLILSTGNELPAWYREPELVSAGESSEYKAGFQLHI